MNLYQKCLAHWSVKSQIKQSMGECGEFIADAQNYMRNRISLEQMMGEVVDVHIMMMQMRELDPEMFERLKEETLKKIEKKVDKQ